MQNLISVPYTPLSEKTQRSPESESGPFKLDPGAYEEMVQHQLSFHVPRGLFKIETRDSAGARLGKAAMSLSCCGGPRSRSESDGHQFPRLSGFAAAIVMSETGLLSFSCTWNV